MVTYIPVASSDNSSTIVKIKLCEEMTVKQDRIDCYKQIQSDEHVTVLFMLVIMVVIFGAVWFFRRN